MPEKSAARRNRRLLLAWVGASALGGAVSAAASRALAVVFGAGGAMGQTLGPVAAETVTGAFILGGLLFGISAGQWFVARRHARWAGALIPAAVAGGAAGGGIGLGVWAALGGTAEPTLPAGLAATSLGLAGFGVAQWFVARGRIPRAGRWGAASTLGLVAANLGLALTAPLVGAGAGAGALYGAVYGAFTARFLPAAGKESP